METKLKNLKVKNLILTEINESFYLDFYNLGKDELMCKTLNWGPFKTSFEAMWVIKNIYNKRPIDEGIPKGYAITLDSKMIGFIDFHDYNLKANSIEIGYFLGTNYWGQGIMTNVLKKIIDYAFNELLVDKIVVGSLIDNIRSIKLIERCNLKYEEEKLVEENGEAKLARFYSIYKFEYKGE